MEKATVAPGADRIVGNRKPVAPGVPVGIVPLAVGLPAEPGRKPKHGRTP